MGPHAGLLKLYSSHWGDFETLIDVSKPAKLNGPYLCSPGQDYWESKIKIVFVGQETNGWAPKSDVVKQMEVYSNFGVAKGYKKGAFWQIIRKIEKSINGKEYCCASLNLNKFDVAGKRPGKSYLSLIEKFDHILLDEIHHLEPDAVIFFTGPNYDRRLVKLFNAELVKVNDFSIREFAEIRSPDIKFKAIRSIHPQRIQRLGRHEEFLTQIINSVNLSSNVELLNVEVKGQNY